MPFLGPSMSATLMSQMASQGMVGPAGKFFADACGIGAMMTVIAKPFTTADTGTITGVGVGTGTGLILIPTLISSIVLAQAAQLALIGPRMPSLASAYGQALTMEAAKITLSSVHSIVFLGVGIVVPASIPIIDMEWERNVFSLGTAFGFIGPQWPSLAKAIAKGSAIGFKPAVGQVTITGTFTGPTPPGPIPGAGTGSGVIT